MTTKRIDWEAVTDVLESWDTPHSADFIRAYVETEGVGELLAGGLNVKEIANPAVRTAAEHLIDAHKGFMAALPSLPVK